MFFLGDECRDLHDSNYCQAMQRESDQCNRGSSKFAYVLCQKTCGNCNFGDTPMKNLKDETDDGKIFKLNFITI